MAFVSGIDRDQTLIFPERLDEYVDPEHPVRFIDAFVAGLDMEQCGFERARPAVTGRPPYDPADLLKLYIWGYLNSVRSSRRLMRECKRNVELIWLLRKLTPDFKTISDFRKDNAAVFKTVFREFGLLCKGLSLWGSELVAIDGTKLKAVNNVSRNHTTSELTAWLERLDARVAEYLNQLEKADIEPAQQGEPKADGISLKEKLGQLKERRAEVQAMLLEVGKTGAKEISRTDPDSRRRGKVGVGYNGQIAVDEKHKLIVEAEVVTDKTDLQQFTSMAKAACEAMEIDLSKSDGAKPKFTADRGYHSGEVLEACEVAGIEGYVPQPRRGHAQVDGHYHKTDFRYDASADRYICPHDIALVRHSVVTKHGGQATLYSNPSACRACPHRSKCTTTSYRRIERYEHDAAVERMAERVAANPQIVRRRGALVEHPFGSMMFWSNQRSLLTRGLEKVRAEFRLSALAYNLKRVVNIVGVRDLLAKVSNQTPAPALAS